MSILQQKNISETMCSDIHKFASKYERSIIIAEIYDLFFTSNHYV